jgi:hypothetical protein
LGKSGFRFFGACSVVILDKGKLVARRGRKAKDRSFHSESGSLVAEGMHRSPAISSCAQRLDEETRVRSFPVGITAAA